MNVRISMLFAALCCALAAQAAGAGQNIWNDVAEESINAVREDRSIVPDRYRTLELDAEALTLLLARAPMEFTDAAEEVVLHLPMPDGRAARFRIEQSPIMEPALASRFPQIRTFRGHGVDDPSATVRFDWTYSGFHAMVLSASDTVYVDPYQRGDTIHYISYFKRDHRRGDGEDGFVCHVDGTGETGFDGSTGARVSHGTELRTYRAAVAATGEYTTYHGGTVNAGMDAIVVAMNRVNGIYERELAVSMSLVANNDQIVYTNGATDPYTNNDGYTMLFENQSNLNSVIGSANYDIGHVFSTGGGGIASLRVPCTNSKAQGVTGLPSPIGDGFYVDYVAHEMGHQFGANHTFNTSSSWCIGQRNASTAYEPGSGSTIMAYAGICSPHNIQWNSDDYFHGASFDEIVSCITNGNCSSCPVVTSTGNTPPTVDAGGGYTIPISTPFSLTGSASDIDGDTLTYCWEEFDLGPAGHPNSPSGNAPIFRSFDPASTPTRLFPRLSNLLNNTQTMGELLPTYARTMNFRMTVRDNRAGGGGADSDAIAVTVVDSAGPFLVTAPNTAVTWNGPGPHDVTWNVAGTDGAPVSCASVDILLSQDGGTSFPFTVLGATANDGFEAVMVGVPDTTEARLKVVCSDNVFFDLSNADFTISGAGDYVFFNGASRSGGTTYWSNAVQ